MGEERGVRRRLKSLLPFTLPPDSPIRGALIGEERAAQRFGQGEVAARIAKSFDVKRLKVKMDVRTGGFALGGLLHCHGK